MSSIQSLGLREPSALPYLIAESILPSDPPPSSYTWTVTHVPDIDGNGSVEEEVLYTKTCVVWSKNGSIKRALNLNVEKEPVSHAFVTEFQGTAQDNNPNSQHAKDAGRNIPRGRALVAVLQTQAHIFLLSGDTHVLPLKFKVQSAFPLPFGFVLQRQLEEQELATNSSIPVQHDLSTINETLTSLGGDSSRSSLVPPIQQPNGTSLLRSDTSRMPRTFSFTNLMSELGVVVWSPLRKGQLLEECKPLPRGDKIVYISQPGDLGQAHHDHQSLCLALTFNEVGSSFTLWHVSQGSSGSSHEHDKSRDKPGKTRASLRKSFNIHGRDVPSITTTTRGPGNLRESYGGAAQHTSDGGLFQSLETNKPFPANDIASQLGPEFGDVGVQTRSARRISSMLARTDLGHGNDRNTFNDLALGHTTRQSLNRAARRGESLGGFSDRQSFGFRRKSSFQANASTFSAGTSFLDVSANGLLDEFDPLRQSLRLEEDTMELQDSNLSRELGFFRIKTFERQQMPQLGGNESDLKVLVLSPSITELHLCVIDKAVQEMTLIKVLVRTKPDRTSKDTISGPSYEIKATDLRRVSGVKDACKVEEGDVQRLVVLTESRTQILSLQLEAPWAPSFRLDPLEKFAMFNPFVSLQLTSPARSKETGTRRTMSAADIRIQMVQASGSAAQVYAIDQHNRRHAVRLELQPGDGMVVKILQMCDLVLNKTGRESLLVAFWEVSRWLKTREPSIDSDWTRLVIVLLSLAVPHISSQLPQSTPHRRKKGGLLRSSSGTTIDLANYELMHDDDNDFDFSSETCAPAWSWLAQKRSNATSTTPRSKAGKGAVLASSDDGSQRKKVSVLLRYISLAKEFVQTPAGEAALGTEGYLPTAISKSREERGNVIPTILLGLHVLYEENKLNNACSSRMDQHKNNLVMVMAQLGHWLNWQAWTCGSNAYYEYEIPDTVNLLFDHSVIDGLRIPPQPFEPPSIFAHLERWIHGVLAGPFLTLARIAGADEAVNLDDAKWQQTSRLTPRTFGLLLCMRSPAAHLSPGSTIATFSQCGLDEMHLKTLPEGVTAGLLQALACRRNNAMSGGLTLPSKDDNQHSNIGDHHHVHGHRLQPSHDALKDYHSICSSALDAEGLQRWDASSEADRHAITKLIFNEDRRFPEASKLVNQTRPPIVECSPEPEWTEVELLDAQKELAQHVTRRTLSVATGRGMMHFNARVPLLTERVPIPAFSLQCIMKPRHSTESAQAMTFSADKAAFTEEKVCWAFFHNGASMGLMISDDAQGIDTSWILYNKPPELTNRHAGFLLALGLNGHLKNLANWVAFKYFIPKHTMTSVGLLLGLSVSFLGTMDTGIMRLFSVHVTRLLPHGAAELNISPLTQTTGIMGIGFLYYNSQHRRMSEVMLSEIENPDAEEGVAPESVLRDEGYRLAAGFSFGLINLGRGKRLHGLHDMKVVERLLSIAVGTKNVNMVHVLDRATAGAVMAMALVFLKTNDDAVARKVDVPDTLHQFDYVRPDIFLLRTLARHLIMWDSIQPTAEFVERSLPPHFRRRADLRSTKTLSTEDMPFFNIIAGICFAVGLRYAGSQRHDVRDLLVSYLDQFLRLSRLSARNYDARVTLNSVRNCLDAIALATASVMAGSGDLVVMRRLRSLHGRTDKDTPFGSHLAAHMALGTLFLAGGTKTFGTSNLAVASLCIAFYPVFPNDVLDNRGHLQALRHLWVLAVENRCLVARDRDGGDSVIGGVLATVHLKDGSQQVLQLPGLIPELETIRRIEVKGEGLWEEVVDFTEGKPQLMKDSIRQEAVINIYLRRRTAYDKPHHDLFAAELQARGQASGIPSIDPNSTVAAHTTSISATGSKLNNAFEWLFGIDSLKDFDHAERALVLGRTTSIPGVDLLKPTVVDTRLELEKGILPSHDAALLSQTDDQPVQKNKLWQLRLLFAWLDRWEKEDEEIERVSDKQVQDLDKWFPENGATWLRKEVIERLRYRVWTMATGNSGGDDDDAVIAGATTTNGDASEEL